MSVANIYSNALLKMQQAAINLTSDALKYMLLTSSYSPNLDTDTNYAGISANEVSGTGYTAGGVGVSGATLSQIAANSWGATWAANTAYSVGQVVKPSSGGNGFLYQCVAAGTSGGNVAPTNGSNASPIVVTAAAHGLSTGNGITIANVTGNTNMNGTFLAVVQSASTYNLMSPSSLTLINGNGTFGGSPTISVAWPTTPGEQVSDGTVIWVCLSSAATKFTITAPSWSNATITARYGVLYDTTASNYLICLDDFGSSFSSTNGTFTVTPDANSGLFIATRV